MNLKTYCFAINSYYQALEIIKISKKNNVVPVLLIKYYLIDSLSIDWLNELKHMLQDQFKSNDFRIFIEAKKNYGLFIGLVEQKINYISIKANEETLKRLSQIAKLNKVVINPSFSVVDLTKTKKINLKLKRLYNKN